MFVLIMKALSGLITKAEEGGFITGFKVARRGGEGVHVSIIACK